MIFWGFFGERDPSAWGGVPEGGDIQAGPEQKEEGFFKERGGPKHPAEEETFKLGHYGFHVCVYSPRPSYNISFSWIFNFFWDILVWRFFVFLWSKI